MISESKLKKIRRSLYDDDGYTRINNPHFDQIFEEAFKAGMKHVNNCVLDDVSGSLSAEECEKLIYYGKLESKGIVLDSDKKHLDYVLLIAFDLLKEKTVFDVEEAKKMFWKRIMALANYR
jgi:hypothetical protein